jgi:AcrR family transcriptional regulator
VFQGAIRVADAGGIDALTMRGLADELGVEAMSLYYHVKNKEAILDGVVDAILAEISEEIGGFTVPDDVVDWKTAMRKRIEGARRVMLRHKWAPAVFETRVTIGLPVMQYMHMLLGIMKEGGLSYDLAHHAMHALGSRALGFSHELFEPDNDDQSNVETADLLAEMADHLPYLVGMMSEITHQGAESTLGWCDDDYEFFFALDLILSGLENAADRHDG